MKLSLDEIQNAALSVVSKIKDFFSSIIERAKKPYVKYDFTVVKECHSDGEEAPDSASETKGSVKIRFSDVIIALTFIAMVVSIFKKKNK